MTIKNAKGKRITFINNSGIETSDTKTYNPTDELYLTDSDEVGDSIFSNDIELIDASQRTKGIEISERNFAKTIKGGKGSDTIYGSLSDALISGGAGNDYIEGGASEGYGNTQKYTLRGGKGNDTLIGSHIRTRSSKMTGGEGNDVFYWEGIANDVITDYKPGEDRILSSELVEGFASVIIKGNDVIFQDKDFGSVLTVKNAKGKKITIGDGEGNRTSQVYGTKTIKVADGDGSTISVNKDINLTVQNINASKRTNSVWLIGNRKNNTIIGGKGNDTIDGGRGKSTLKGGKGNDVFIVDKGDAGEVVITDYTAGDTVYLKSTDSSKYDASVKGSNVVLTFGNSKVTLKNAKNKKITIKTNEATITEKYSSNSNYIEAASNNVEEIWFTKCNENVGSEVDSLLDEASNGTAPLGSYGLSMSAVNSVTSAADDLFQVNSTAISTYIQRDKV